jgi:hypothetical protein
LTEGWWLRETSATSKKPTSTKEGGRNAAFLSSNRLAAKNKQAERLCCASRLWLFRKS